MIVKLCLAVGIAILVSALCSAIEAVLYSVPASRVEILAKSNKLETAQLITPSCLNSLSADSISSALLTNMAA